MMSSNEPYHFDIAWGSLNKQGEELCGDRTVVRQDGDQVLIVLADGLGSGVKANILSTLTTRIAMTMLLNQASAAETFETILSTLPTCRVRGIAYCTLSIIQADRAGNCSIFEYDTPPAILIRKGRPVPLQREASFISGRKVHTTRCLLLPGDILTSVSDGAIHAGLGRVFNHGWEWENVQDYLARIDAASAYQSASALLSACRNLYGGLPGDDTTVAALMLKHPQETHLLIGPPSDRGSDAAVVKAFMDAPGSKIVCGGSTASMTARELRRPLSASMEYPDPSVPPTAELEGIDLVTEGVVTLNRVLRHLEAYAADILSFDASGADGATAICRSLLNDSTRIRFWLGTAENPAHNQPDFYRDYERKQAVLERIIELLKGLGKDVSKCYTA